MTSSLKFALALSVMGGAAQAATLDDSIVEDLLFTYNGASAGSFVANSETEGRLYVGGSLTGNQTQIEFKPLLGTGPILTVKGSAQINFSIGTTSDNYISGSLAGNPQVTGGANQNQTNIFVGGAFGGNDNFGLVTTGPVAATEIANNSPTIDFPSLVDYSAYLSTLTGAVLDTSDQNQIRLDKLNNAVQSEGSDWDAALVTVYEVDLANLRSGTIFSDISSTDAETIIVNVSGSSGTYGLNPAGDFANDDGQRIVWNFYEATMLSLGSKLIGSVLAPQANVSGFNGNLEGAVFAGSIDQTNGELHYQPFQGDLPSMPVPLPAGLPLLAAGLAAFGLIRRRA